MLLMLAKWIGHDIRLFNVFNYITLRAVLSALTALLISFLVGPWMIRRLTHLKVGQPVRDDGPQTHLVKAGTPTMGGALILAAVAITTLLWADLTNSYIWKPSQHCCYSNIDFFYWSCNCLPNDSIANCSRIWNMHMDWSYIEHHLHIQRYKL